MAYFVGYTYSTEKLKILGRVVLKNMYQKRCYLRIYLMNTYLFYMNKGS